MFNSNTARSVAGQAIALVFVLSVDPRPARAQSLEPRAYSNVPVGLNFAGVGYDYSEGKVSFDPAVPLTDAHIHTNTEFLAYSHSLGLWSKSAKIDVVVPVVALSGSALLAGQRKTRDISGLADPLFKFAINFFGAPAVDLAQFRGYHQDLIVGASLRISAPLGQYDNNKLVNIGTNRWSFRPELGASKVLGLWTCDLYGSATFYTSNNDFQNGGTIQQDPLYALQAHVMRSFPRGIWVALNSTYYWGARTTVNDRQTDSLQANSRFGMTLALPVTSRHSLKLYGATGTSSRTKNNFSNGGIVWQYRWGAGL